jgi:hypothetical protein
LANLDPADECPGGIAKTASQTSDPMNRKCNRQSTQQLFGVFFYRLCPPIYFSTSETRSAYHYPVCSPSKAIATSPRLPFLAALIRIFHLDRGKRIKLMIFICSEAVSKVMKCVVWTEKASPQGSSDMGWCSILRSGSLTE